MLVSKHSWDGLTGPLVWWAVGVTVLVLVLAVALAQYGDFGEVVAALR